jgi:hypothetical protein
MRYPGFTVLGLALQVGASVVTAILLQFFFVDEMLELSIKERRHRFAVMDRIRILIIVFQVRS